MAAVLIAGCRNDRSAQFTPEVSTARAALDSALSAWSESGPKAKPAAVGDVAVEVIDHARKPNQRLLRYEVLGEIAAENGRWFEVKLTLAQPQEIRITRYVIVGISPLWVFGAEDYAMLQHWEHPMEAPPETKAKVE